MTAVVISDIYGSFKDPSNMTCRFCDPVDFVVNISPYASSFLFHLENVFNHAVETLMFHAVLSC